MSIHKKKMTYFLLLCLFSLANLGSRCEADWRQPLLLKKPKGSLQKKIRWFRLTFYKLSLLERKRQDGGDRIRRFVKRFPQLARKTYMANIKAFVERRKKGQKIGAFEHFYIQMNHFIKMTLPKTKWPPFQFDRSLKQLTLKRVQ